MHPIIFNKIDAIYINFIVPIHIFSIIVLKRKRLIAVYIFSTNFIYLCKKINTNTIKCCLRMDRFLTSFCEPNLNLTEKLPIMLNNLADKCKRSINVANIPKIIIFFQNFYQLQYMFFIFL